MIQSKTLISSSLCILISREAHILLQGTLEIHWKPIKVNYLRRNPIGANIVDNKKKEKYIYRSNHVVRHCYHN